MEFLDWKYAGKDHTPTKGELKEYLIGELLYCIRAALKHDLKCSTECGGFKIDVDLQDEPTISAYFVVTEWCYGY